MLPAMERSLAEHDVFRRLIALPFVEAVWLFGSQARGTAGARSDADLAIACPRATPADWRIVEAVMAGADTLRRLDAVRWDALREDDPLRQAILADRVLLYAREPWMADRDADFRSAHDRLGDALSRLSEGLAEPGALEHPLMRDGLVQRFEFTVEQFWKTLRFALRRRGLDPAGSPRSVLEAAFAEGWIEDEAGWLAMVDDRNRTSHAYRKAVADEVLGRLPGHLTRMQALAARLPGLTA